MTSLQKNKLEIPKSSFGKVTKSQLKRDFVTIAIHIFYALLVEGHDHYSLKFDFIVTMIL